MVFLNNQNPIVCRYSRSLIAELACDSGVEACIANVKNDFNLWMNDENNNLYVSARPIFICNE